jgi:hypothetical protein
VSDKTKKEELEDTPLYLTQGCFVFIFSTAIKAETARQEARYAFENGEDFRGFKIKTKKYGNSQVPWFIPAYCCIICGIENLPQGFCSNPEIDDVIVCNWPPIVIGGQVRSFGLRTVRLQAVHIEKETKIALALAKAS